jgi:PAS domain S-box-containing protein
MERAPLSPQSLPADALAHAGHLFWLSPDLLAAAGYDGLLKVHNAAWTPQLGYDSDELRTTPYLDFVHPEDREDTVAVIARLAEGEQISEYECRIVRADGTIRTYAWSGSPGEDVFYITGRDVTERRALERDAREFAHVASHDLSEPLRAVTGYLELLERDAGAQLDDRTRGWLRAASDGARRMRRLIDEVLRYSRVANANEAWEPVDLEIVAGEVLEALGPAIAETGARVEMGALPTVVGQPTQLGQVLQNLVANAVKFRGEGSPRVQVGARRVPEGWIVTVTDDGPGIAPADRQRIFAMFTRARGVTQSDPLGSGIGLALCRRIVEHHGGRIWVEPAPEGGSAFHALLPDRI